METRSQKRNNAKITKSSSKIMTVSPNSFIDKRHGLLVCIGEGIGLKGLYENIDNLYELFNVQLRYRGGFKCNALKDPRPVQFRHAILELCKELEKDPNSIGLFYYAGHGSVLEEEIILEKDIVEPLFNVKNMGTILIMECCTPSCVLDLSKKYKDKIYFICSSKPGTSTYVYLPFGGHFSQAFINTLSSPCAFGKTLDVICQELTEKMKKLIANQSPFFSSCKELTRFCFITNQLQICTLCGPNNLHEDDLFECLNCRMTLCNFHKGLHTIDHYLSIWKNGTYTVYPPEKNICQIYTPQSKL